MVKLGRFAGTTCRRRVREWRDDRRTRADRHHQQRRIDAVVFDMDGVVTQTATVHAAAWTALFDAYLRRRERGE